MSVSRKVLRKMKKVMGVIGASAVLVPCSSQISCALLIGFFHDCSNGNNIQYVLDSKGVLTISGEGVVTKRCINRLLNSHIIAVDIREGIRGISYYAFTGCKYLREVNIPASVEFIRDYAFMGCTSLEKFKCCDFRRFHYDGGLCLGPGIIMGAEVFRSCHKLQLVYFGNRMITIHKKTFYDCDECFMAINNLLCDNVSRCTEDYRIHNFVIPHAFLVDSMNDRINRRRG